MTFLSIYTPTFRRPFLLELCKASVAAQSAPVEHVVVEDKVGVGVYRMIRDHVGEVHGEYVMVLSDDNVLVDGEFAADLATEAFEADLPDVVMFKGQIASTLQPAAWACEPIATMVDLSCFAVRRDVWLAHAADWGDRYLGDFDFIHSLWTAGCRFYWWDRLVFRALQVTGRPT